MMDCISDDVVASYFRRWSEIEDRKAEAAEDAKELAKEAKGNGFNVKAMRAAFARRRAAAEKGAEIEEFEAEVDLYAAALDRGLNPGTRVATQARDVRVRHSATEAPVASASESREPAEASAAPADAPAETATVNTAPGASPLRPATGGQGDQGDAWLSEHPAGDRGHKHTGHASSAGPDVGGEAGAVSPPRTAAESAAGYVPTPVKRSTVTDDDLGDDPWLRARFGASGEARP